MKKLAYILPALAISAGASAQSAMDGFSFSKNDLNGTARFMSMGGAFGALGGDLSVLSQNPGGIGVYRGSEIGFTLNLDNQHSTSAGAFSLNKTRMLLNNIGGVATVKLANSLFPNINFGFTYNKAASFNRSYQGGMNLSNSMSNYIAGISNFTGCTVGDLESTQGYDPYNPTDGGFVAPWISILGYDSYLISPEGNSTTGENWVGQWGQGTSGKGSFRTDIHGAADEYNISFGGNISNILYWGMDFGIVDLNYTAQTMWEENLTDAYVEGVRQNADWSLSNYYNVNGNGFNYKIGFIVKPIQELRLGFAVHTPTWYNITESFFGQVDYQYSGDIRSGNAQTNDGYDGYNAYNFRTPMHLIASAAGVIGSRFILSGDYEWQPYGNMKFTSGPDSWYDAFQDANNDIKTMYGNVNTVRVGAEYRVTPAFSIRAGYSYSSSPVQKSVLDGNGEAYPAGTRPSYVLNNSSQYVSCGLGYKFGRLSIDLAYVYKHLQSDFHAYPAAGYVSMPGAPTAKVTTDRNQVLLSATVRL